MSFEYEDYVYDDHNNYSFDDDYDDKVKENAELDNKFKNNVSIKKNIFTSNITKNYLSQDLNFQKINKILTKKKNKKKKIEFKNDENILNKKDFSPKNRIKANNEFDKSTTELKSIHNRDLILEGKDQVNKPDFNNWSEDRLKEEIKNYGIRPTSIKNIIKQLNEIWEFFNLSNNLFDIK